MIRLALGHAFPVLAATATAAAAARQVTAGAPAVAAEAATSRFEFAV